MKTKTYSGPLYQALVEEMMVMAHRGMDFTPKPDDMVKNAKVLYADLKAANLADTEADAERVREAMQQCGRDLTKWPSVRHIVDRLPARRLKQLEAPPVSLDQKPLHGGLGQTYRQHLEEMGVPLNCSGAALAEICKARLKERPGDLMAAAPAVAAILQTYEPGADG